MVRTSSFFFFFKVKILISFWHFLGKTSSLKEKWMGGGEGEEEVETNLELANPPFKMREGEKEG